MKVFSITVLPLTHISMLILGGMIAVACTAEGRVIDILNAYAGGNLFSPFAIVLSATLASFAAFWGLRENGIRERNKWTLEHLKYKRFSWVGIRIITPCLEELQRNSREMDVFSFSRYLREKRERCGDLSKVISFLESYQQIAFGIQEGLYDENTGKLYCGKQLVYLYENSWPYIKWRRIEKGIKGVANQSNIYEDLESMAKKWKSYSPNNRVESDAHPQCFFCAFE